MDVLAYLQENRDVAGNIPDHPLPGVYAIFTADRNCLSPIEISSTGLIYIGLSTILANRNHFIASNSGFHTIRRTLGAILKDELKLAAIPRASGPSASNFENYRFAGLGESRLSAWMRDKLECGIFLCDGDLQKLETELVREGEPPLNLTKWSNPQKLKIQTLRNACKAEARLSWPLLR